MALTHLTVKIAGQRVFAVADWNADHVADAVLVPNLNADLLDGYEAIAFGLLSANNIWIGNNTFTQSLTIGNGAAGVDYNITFVGENSTGIITWDEDLDTFWFQDELTMFDGERLIFRGTANYIYSPAPANLVIASPNILLDGDVIIDTGHSLRIPVASDPTVDAEGEIAWDSNDDQLVVYDGSNERQIPSTFSVDKLFFAPDYINDKIPIFYCNDKDFPNGAKITHVSITLPADAAYSMPFEEWSGDPPTEDAVIETVSTTGADSYAEVEDGNIDNPDLEPNDYIFVDIPSTNVDWIFVKVIGYRKGS